jgi:S1-C subfamily serine protease
MDIEQLNKSQIVLLTLLVSFVTSIATGIVTVSLMEQAPPAIAQTVNRVIERTVETVAPAPQGQTAAATVITQEKTVVVSETDLISQAVQKVTPAIVRIYDNKEESPTFHAIGIVLDTKGSIVTDSASITGSDYTVALSDGTRVRMFVNARDKVSGFAFLQPATTTGNATPTWKPAAIASNKVLLGGTVVAVAGRTVARIHPGVVTATPEDKIVDTNIPTESILPGSPIINTDGSIVGVSTSESRTSSATGFMSTMLLLPPQ